MAEPRMDLAGRTVSVCPACGEPAAVWPEIGEQVVAAEPWAPPAQYSLDELIQSYAQHQARCCDADVERQIRAHAAQHAPEELLRQLADTRQHLLAVVKLVQNAQLVSPSPRMPVYVGDLLAALGLAEARRVPTKNDAANPPPRASGPHGRKVRYCRAQHHTHTHPREGTAPCPTHPHCSTAPPTAPSWTASG